MKRSFPDSPSFVFPAKYRPEKTRRRQYCSPRVRFAEDMHALIIRSLPIVANSYLFEAIFGARVRELAIEVPPLSRQTPKITTPPQHCVGQHIAASRPAVEIFTRGTGHKPISCIPAAFRDALRCGHPHCAESILGSAFGEGSPVRLGDAVEHLVGDGREIPLSENHGNITDCFLALAGDNIDIGLEQSDFSLWGKLVASSLAAPFVVLENGKLAGDSEKISWAETIQIILMPLLDHYLTRRNFGEFLITCHLSTIGGRHEDKRVFDEAAKLGQKVHFETVLPPDCDRRGRYGRDQDYIDRVRATYALPPLRFC